MRKFLSGILVVGLGIFSMATFTSCDLDELSGNGSTCSWNRGVVGDILDVATGADCNLMVREHADLENRQGRLLSLETVKDRMQKYPKDYSMAMVLNADAINKLFQASTNWSFSGVNVEMPKIQVGGCRPGGGRTVTGISDNNCLSFDFGLKVDGYGARVVFGVPITAVVKGGGGPDAVGSAAGKLRTTIFADLPKAQILDISGYGGGSGGSLGVFGSQLVEAAVKALIGDKLHRVGLFDISAWEMGDGNIQLLAGGPVTNEKEGTLTLGMYSNIDLGIPDTALGEESRVTWEKSFPKNAEVALHIHPDLLRGLLGLMMSEGHIESDMTASEESSSTSGVSSFNVTMADMTEYPMQTLMTCGDEWKDYFTVGLRMWSTADVCGYFDVLAGLRVNVTDTRFEMGIGNIQAGKAQGIGALAKFAVNSLTGTKTFKDVMSQATIAFNYDQFDIAAEKDSTIGETKNLMTNAVDFRLDGNGVSLYLNFPELKLK